MRQTQRNIIVYTFSVFPIHLFITFLQWNRKRNDGILKFESNMHESE